MPVPSSINDLSTVAGSNGPLGSETPTTGDDYIRALSSFLAQLRDQLNGTGNTGTVKNAAFSGTQTGASSWSGAQAFNGGITGTTGVFSGAVTASNIVAAPSGTYTPTFTPGLNCAGTPSSGSPWIWSRDGDVVVVSGYISSTGAFTAASISEFLISLPIASNLGQVSDLCGSFSCGVLDAVVGVDIVNDKAKVVLTPPTTSGRAGPVLFQYRVI